MNTFNLILGNWVALEQLWSWKEGGTYLLFPMEIAGVDCVLTLPVLPPPQPAPSITFSILVNGGTSVVQA